MTNLLNSIVDLILSLMRVKGLTILVALIVLFFVVAGAEYIDLSFPILPLGQ